MTTFSRTLVLSSSSPARQDLLKRIGIPFTTIKPNVDETPLPGEDARTLVLRLAEAKAKAVAKQYPDALIIGSDQVGTLDNHILGKPLTHENAVSQLRLVSGRMIRFYTGLCLYDAQRDSSDIAVETYDVYKRNLTNEMIDHYLKKEKALHCAGSVHVEGFGICLIDKLCGDDYTALIGLPLIRLTKMLESAGAPVI